MKMKRIALLPVLAALMFSGCSEGMASNTTTSSDIADTISGAIISSYASETVSETEGGIEVGNSLAEPEGFVFQDLTGAVVDKSLVSGYTLKYAVCWQPSARGLTAVDNAFVINGMAVTDAFSNYCISTTSKGSSSVNCNRSGYSLISSEDPFQAFSAECVLRKDSESSLWYL